MINLPPSDVLQHVVDVHSHPTDAPLVLPESMDRLQITVCAMATRQSDQVLVHNLATAYPSKIVPCFGMFLLTISNRETVANRDVSVPKLLDTRIKGYHPWFSHSVTTNSTVSKEDHYKHLFLDSQTSANPEHQEIFKDILPHLPEPRTLDEVLNELRQNLTNFPNAMVGEVGLDRSFHVPYNYDTTPRKHTPFSVPLDHQLALLEAQLDIAIEFGRNASIHSVKSQKATVDLLDRLHKKHGDAFYRISIDMHSCGFSKETWKAVEKNKYINVFLSLSMVINEKHLSYKALIAACSDDRILVESDYNDIDMSTSQTWRMLENVAEIKKWNIEKAWVDTLDEKEWGAVRRLEQNWFKFRNGNHPPPKSAKNRKKSDRYHSPPPS